MPLAVDGGPAACAGGELLCVPPVMVGDEAAAGDDGAGRHAETSDALAMAMHAPTTAARAADAVREVNMRASEVPSEKRIACKR